MLTKNLKEALPGHFWTPYDASILDRRTEPVGSANTVMVRMKKDMAERWSLLRREFEGLPPSSLARMIISATLALPLEQQIQIIQTQIRKPGSTPTCYQNRLHNKFSRNAKRPSGRHNS